MSVFNSQPPKINQNHLIKWLKENYSFLNKKSISLKLLNSERDKNFIIIVNFKPKYVLKISNSEESRAILELQDYVLTRLSKRNSIKKCIPKKIHSSIKMYLDLMDRKCYVRILNYFDGRMYASVKHNSVLEKSLGT